MCVCVCVCVCECVRLLLPSRNESPSSTRPSFPWLGESGAPVTSWRWWWLSRLYTWPLLAQVGVGPQCFLWYFAPVSDYFLKVFCLVRLSYSSFLGWRQQAFPGLCLWILPASDFSSTQSGISKGKRKFRELTTRLSSGADAPSHSPSLNSSLFSLLKSVLYMMSRVFSCA